ncbi:hypothetical protein [Azonexus hydrophilus]|uniref:hypothetical protein n=1 Tax=Azonexus hydrophilus TaxID=418702 RepID=UPI00249082DC|nr:hypothetical protein [Azonexus hydrophilus]
MGLLSLIPLPYRILAGLLIAAMIAAAVWMNGAAHVQAKWDAATVKQSLRVASVEKAQAESTVKIVTKFVDRVRVVKETGAALTREVVRYVPSDSCDLPPGYRVLHDAAARGEPADTAGSVDAATVSAQDAAAAVIDNYSACHANAEQLVALQNWIVETRQAAHRAVAEND